MKTSTTGMMAQKIKLAVIAENVGNVSTMKVEETSEPYRRKYPVLESYAGGVRVTAINTDRRKPAYSDAEVANLDETGFTELPNVNLIEEMTDLTYTNYMFEGNTTCLKTARSLYQSTIDTLK